MSWQATAWAQAKKTGSPAKKALLLVLANYADEEGVCWPAQKTLAASTEQSVDSVQRQSRQLQAIGIVRTACRWPRERGKWPAFLYVLAMENKATEPQLAARSNRTRPGRTQPDDRAAPSPTTGPQALRHEPSLELPIEPSSPPLPPAKQAEGRWADRGSYQNHALNGEVLPPETEISFIEFWNATNRQGQVGPASGLWKKLSIEDRRAIKRFLMERGTINTGNTWTMKWLELRAWEQPMPMSEWDSAKDALNKYVSNQPSNQPDAKRDQARAQRSLLHLLTQRFGALNVSVALMPATMMPCGLWMTGRRPAWALASASTSTIYRRQPNDDA